MCVIAWFLGQILFPAGLTLNLLIKQMTLGKDESVKNDHLPGPCGNSGTHGPFCNILTD